MKNSYLLIPICLLVVILAAACGGSGPAASVGGVSEAPKQPVLSPTEIPKATSAPVAAVDKAYYDDFSQENSGWSKLQVVTTQGQLGTMQSKAELDTNKMVFDFRELETYMYRFYDMRSAADVVIETKVTPGGHNSNGMALVCRANSDKTAWYEARLSSTSQYWIYRYDSKLKTEQNKNPYVTLKQGGMAINIFHPASENVVRLTCQGTSLKLEVNGNLVATVQDGALKDAGLTGLGAMSHEILPVNIQFSYFSYGQP